MSNSSGALPSNLFDDWLDLWTRADSASKPRPSLDDFVRLHPSMSARELADVLLVDQHMRWQDRAGPNVDDYLDRFPTIGADSNTIIDLIIGELRASERLGLPIAIDTMARRFPQYADEIAKQVELASWIDAESSESAPRPSDTRLELSVGSTFGDYELLERIGNGGMGAIFRARHRQVQRTVALKILSPERMASEDHRKRFRNEAVTVAKLDHPNIMPVYEVGEVEGIPFFTTRFVTPGNLEANARVVCTNPKATAETMKQISEAVYFAHCHGVLHRDLKPSNVLVDQSDTPYVTDFGLARIMGETCRLTVAGELLGTPVWMSPELVDGKGREPTVASDIYGLGAILYFLLTGQPPHGGRSFVETLEEIRHQDPPTARSLNQSVPRDLDLICRRAMDRVPSRRYESAGAMAYDLERFLNGQPVDARPLPWWEIERRRIIQHPVWATVLVAVLILISGATYYTLKLSSLNTRLAGLVREAATVRNDAVHLRRDARQANNDAVRLQKEAAAVRLLAKRAHDDHQQLRYVAHMRLAWQAWQSRDLRHADALLKEFADPVGKDLRGFAWHYLDARVNPLSRDFQIPIGEARCMALSADESTMAVGTNNGSVVLLDPSGRQLQSIQTPLGVIKWLTTGPGDSVLAVSHGGLAAMITPGERAAVTRWGDRHDFLTLLQIPGSNRLISTHNDATLCEWNDEGELLRQIDLPKGCAQAAAVSADGKTVMVASGRHLETRSSESFDVQHEYSVTMEHGDITDVALSHDATRCALGRSAGWLHAYSVSERGIGELLCEELLDSPKGVDISADGDMAAACDYSGTVHVFQIESSGSTCNHSRVLLSASGHQGRGYAIKFSQDGSEVSSSGRDGLVRKWALPPKGDIIQLPEGISYHCPPATLAHGQILVTGSECGIHRVNLDSQTVVKIADKLPSEHVAVTSSGRLLICGDSKVARVEARLFDETGLSKRPQWAVDNLACDQLVFSPDETKIAVVDWTNDVVVILDCETGENVVRLPARQCWAAAWAPSGRQIAFVVMDDIHIAETDRWNTVEKLKAHTTTVRALAWSADGAMLASAGGDRRVCLWDPATGTLQRTMLGHRSGIQYAVFSPDGGSLLTADTHGNVLLWHVATGEFIGQLSDGNHLSRSLVFLPNENRIVGLSRADELVSFQAKRSWVEP